MFLLLSSSLLLLSSLWRRTIEFRSSRKIQFYIKFQSWDIWIWCCCRWCCCCCCRCCHCHHPCDGVLWAWGPREKFNSISSYINSISSSKAEIFEFDVFVVVVVVVVVDVVVVVVLLVMEYYGLQVLVKIPGLYQAPMLRNLISKNIQVFWHLPGQ